VGSSATRIVRSCGAYGPSATTSRLRRKTDKAVAADAAGCNPVASWAGQRPKKLRCTTFLAPVLPGARDVVLEQALGQALEAAGISQVRCSTASD